MLKYNELTKDAHLHDGNEKEVERLITLLESNQIKSLYLEYSYLRFFSDRILNVLSKSNSLISVTLKGTTFNNIAELIDVIRKHHPGLTDLTIR
ncbi:MAG: hypothetical protein ACHP65_07545, partial [Legionellales bacterium]